MMLDRYWINAPSVLQLHHDLHGTRVIAPRNLDEDFVTVYFVSGDIISQRIPISSLSKGWPEHTK